ncbi:MAG: sulfotransferase [Bacteroidota bacterium]
MIKTPNILQNLPDTHFLLCTERTGSSLLSLMMNLHGNVVCPSEEPFALFFYDSYKNKTEWTESELHQFIDEFWLMAEKNLDLFFTSKQKLFEALIKYKSNLDYKQLCSIIYLQFFEPKPKDNITIILDKQIKYFFYLKKLLELFPDSKFVILVRDPRVNAVRKKSRNLNAGQHPLYLAALWNNTYKNIAYLKAKHKHVLIVKYEELVSEPETILKTVCEFLGISYTNEMLKTEGVYESFLNMQEDRVNADHLTYLKDFQSSLFQKVNKEKIHLKENEMDVVINDKIVKLTGPLLKEFNYDTKVMSGKAISFNLNDRWQIFKSYLYRPLLIQFYLHIPLSVKVIIKRLRK